MTKKDYELIAEAIKTAYLRVGRGGAKQQPHEILGIVTSSLVDKLRLDNERFDIDKFTAATIPTLEEVEHYIVLMDKIEEVNDILR